jgi:YidC/Oxa1 family membrane protein insertase
MEKRQVAFIVTCCVLLAGWLIFFSPKRTQPSREKPAPTEETQPTALTQEGPETTVEPESGSAGPSEPATTTEPTQPTESDTTAAGPAVSGETTEVGETTPAEKTTEPETVAPFTPVSYTLSNPFLTFEISSRGGVIRQATIETKETSKGHGIVIHGTERYTFCDDELAEKHWDWLPLAVFPESKTAPNLSEVEFAKVENESDDRTLVLRYEGASISATKRFVLPKDGYRIEVTLTLENKQAEKVGYCLQVGSVTPIDTLHPRGEARITVDTGAVHGMTAANEKKQEFSQDASVVRWGAVANKYFAAILDMRGPKGTEEARARELVSQWEFLRYTDASKKYKLGATSLHVKLRELDGGETRTYEMLLYVGPKEYSRLRPLGFSKVMSRSFIAPLASALMSVLNAIYGVIPNYGVAIILLTVVIKALLFPLDRRSFKSMKEMQKIQPLIAQLKEKYKDDKQRLQIEQMNLFKEHKVNPLGGCFPMLLQFPVLVAMFTMLRNAVELWRAPFVGYINDLSAPDTLFTIPSVPLLGTLPIHVLPILMTVFTILSQRLRGQSQAVDPQQKMMTQIMPVMFLFIFYGFPSGLNLYWLCSTVFSFGTQMVIQKRDDAREQPDQKKAATAQKNTKKEKGRA